MLTLLTYSFQSLLKQEGNPQKNSLNDASYGKMIHIFGHFFPILYTPPWKLDNPYYHNCRLKNPQRLWLANTFTINFDISYFSHNFSPKRVIKSRNLRQLCFFRIHFILLTFATIYKLALGIQHHANTISYVKICTIWFSSWQFLSLMSHFGLFPQSTLLGQSHCTFEGRYNNCIPFPKRQKKCH